MSDRGDLASERAIIATAGLCAMLVPLNSTMIAVALPSIARAFDASLAQTGWLATAYLIVMASAQPVTGKLGDRFGRRPFLIGGVLAFGVTSVGAALSTSIWMLIAFRGGQAVAGAVLFPNVPALLREIVPAERRGARFGLLGSSIAFGAAIGPSLGGLLLELGGWPAVFWVNVPVSLIILAFGWRTIPRAQRRGSTVRFDTAGALLLALILASGAWMLTRIGDLDARVASIVGAAVVVGAVVFARRELRHADPVIQLRFFRRRPFAAAVGGVGLSNVSLYVLLLVVPQILGRREGWSASGIGLALTALSAGLVVFAPVGGRLGDRAGRRVPVVIGMAILSCGGVLLAIAGPDVSGTTLVLSLVLCGIGLGMGAGSLQTAAVEAIEPEHAGMAAAASMASRYSGSILGAAMLTGFLTAGAGFEPTLIISAVGSIGALMLAPFLPKRPYRAVSTGVIPGK